ncbi:MULTISPECIES: hypothetical protein [Streptomyces]|uniref:Secreted protein n=2 Tax=Streptomyces TaxID=1883 RepID=A0A646KGM7_STRJU|nr:MULTISPECIES: hypothetical protein [Streptomyces]MQS37801.1 hypothetical protein [Streptomyces katsurahamanus]MQT01405.1 hypothetical protein [Streptomyces jumonjinensis]
MASIRTARVLAVAAALPLTVALLSGVAAADNGVFADNGSSATVAAIVGGGVNGLGDSSTIQQVATTPGAANVNNSGFTVFDQDSHTVNFTPLWF